MQQCFDGPVVLSLNEANLKMATFLKASGLIGKNLTPGLKWTFQGAVRDMVDEIAGGKEHWFVSNVGILENLLKLWRVHAQLISRFLTSKQKHTRGDTGS